VTRTYELTFVVDPRLSDEEVVALTGDYKQMAAASGGTVVKEESWGKRRLAYPVNKLTEGRYMLLYVTAEDKNPLTEVVLRMRQNDQVLRFLTVRTDRPVEAVQSVAAPAAAAAEEA
jgi:small subunit ribosomal protein S6